MVRIVDIDGISYSEASERSRTRAATIEAQIADCVPTATRTVSEGRVIVLVSHPVATILVHNHGTLMSATDLLDPC